MLARSHPLVDQHILEQKAHTQFSLWERLVLYRLLRGKWATTPGSSQVFFLEGVIIKGLYSQSPLRFLALQDRRAIGLQTSPLTEVYYGPVDRALAWLSGGRTPILGSAIHPPCECGQVTLFLGVCFPWACFDHLSSALRGLPLCLNRTQHKGLKCFGNNEELISIRILVSL